MEGNGSYDFETAQILERLGFIQGRLIMDNPKGRKLDNYLAEMKQIDRELGERGITINPPGTAYGIFPE